MVGSKTFQLNYPGLLGAGTRIPRRHQLHLAESDPIINGEPAFGIVGPEGAPSRLTTRVWRNLSSYEPGYAGCTDVDVCLDGELVDVTVFFWLR